LASRRQWLIQAQVRSTIQRLGVDDWQHSLDCLPLPAAIATMFEEHEIGRV
jgi:hypothetical protein